MLNTKPLNLQDGWSIANPEDAHMDARALSELTQWVEQTYQYQNTHAVLIEHAGKLVYELYLEGQDEQYYDPRSDRKFDVNSLHDLRSISKSVTSLLLGLAFKDDYQQALATPITEFFKDQNIAYDNAIESITLQHVLTMTAGFEWDEWTLPYSDPRNSDHQLHLVGNPVASALVLAVKDQPGTVWTYSGGSTEILAAIIEQKTGMRLDKFAAEALFEPLGISSFEWLGSPNWQPQGRPSAASGLRLRARDLAKIGSLMLHNGVWNNRRIVPAEWLKLSVQSHVTESINGPRGIYGYGFQWWPGRSNSIPAYKIIAGFGLGGQQLLIVPERHLVVTVFAGNYSREGADSFNWVLGRVALAHRKHD